MTSFYDELLSQAQAPKEGPVFDPLSGSDEYLVEGALLHCPLGEELAFLLLPEDHGVRATGSGGGGTLCNIDDCKLDDNIPAPYFSKCDKDKTPCQPSFEQWKGGNEKMLVDGKNALTMGSTLQCMRFPGEKFARIYALVSGQGHLDLLGLIKEAQGGGAPRLAVLLAMRYGVYGDSKKEDAFFKGKRLACLYLSDPINTVTGNFIDEVGDITLVGPITLQFRRFYNAQSDQSGMIGLGWVCNFDVKLTDYEDAIAVLFEDGSQEVHIKEPGEPSLFRLLDATHTATYRRGGGYVLTAPTGETLDFDKTGTLIHRTSHTGAITQYFYESNPNRLIRIEGEQMAMHFCYNAEGLLESVSDHTGRTVNFAYERGCLVQVTGMAGEERNYAYNELGYLTEETSPSGDITYKNTYDSQGRVIRQTFADGGVVTLAYHEEEQYTITTEQNGNQIKSYHDDANRTIKVEYEDSEERYIYNDNNQKTSHTDRNGNTYRYRYDTRGNLIKSTDPLRNVTQQQFDEKNQLIRSRLPNGAEVSYSYNNQDKLTEVVDPLGRKIEYAYHPRTRELQQCTLPDGSIISYRYDKRGNISEIKNPFGETTTYTYDALNRVIKTTNAAGHTTLFDYTTGGKLKKLTNANGQVKKYTYNTQGLVTKFTDFNGGTSEYYYNEMNYIIKAVNPVGGVTSCQYDTMWNISSVTNPNGDTMKFGYDQYNRVIETIDGEGHSLKYEYDQGGNKTAVIFPSGSRMTYSYDALNRVTEKTEPDGGKTKYEYDKVGNIVSVTNPVGVVTEFCYDLAKQLTMASNSLGEQWSYTYTQLGKIESIIDPAQRVHRYTYEPGGRLKKVTDPNNTYQEYEYDLVGNIIQINTQDGMVSQMEYDDLNRVVLMRDALGNPQHFLYDDAGNTCSVIDANGGKTQFYYSLNGKLIESVDALRHSTKYEYNPVGLLTKIEQYRTINDRLTAIKERETQTTRYEYNANGDTIAVIDALGYCRKYDYDEDRQLIAMTNEAGMTTRYTYDELGRPTKIVHPDGKEVLLQYNEMRQLQQIQDWLGVSSYERDEYGRLTKVTDSFEKTVEYTWNIFNKKEKIIYPDGSEIRYGYNHVGQMTEVESPKGKTKYQYNPSGQLIKAIRPYGLESTYLYDERGDLEQLTHAQDGTHLDNFSYQRDKNGNILKIDKKSSTYEADQGATCYSYDLLNRLTTVSCGGHTRKYKYDSVGNRISCMSDGISGPYSYNALNQLIESRDGRSISSYAYDACGNMITKSAYGKVSENHHYDAQNLLESILYADGTSIHYEYDGTRNCVRKTLKQSNDCVGTNFVTDITKPYHNLIHTHGALNQNHIWGLGLCATEGARGGEEDLIYLCDHLSSPTRIYAPEEEMQHRVMSFDEFGKQSTKRIESNSPFGFASYIRASQDRYACGSARQYDPNTGQMLAKDPVVYTLNQSINNNKSLNTKLINPYPYCFGNPISLVDPSGCTPVDAIGSWLDEAWSRRKNGNLVDKSSADRIDQSYRFWFGDGYDSLKNITKDGNLPEFLGFLYNAERGIYTSRVDAWQKVGGYNKWYDDIFRAVTSMQEQTFKFEADDRHWMIEFWKGYYLNLGTGAEIGIYYNEKGGWHYRSSDDLYPMTNEVYGLHGNKLFEADPQGHWWLTAFSPSTKLTADEIVMESSIELTGEMLTAFKASLKENHNFYWTVDPKKNTRVIVAM